MSTGCCSEGFLPAVKSAKTFDCPQRPGGLAALSVFPDVEIFCLTNLPKTSSRLCGCSTRLSNGSPQWLVISASAFSGNVGLCLPCPPLPSPFGSLFGSRGIPWQHYGFQKGRCVPCLSKVLAVTCECCRVRSG